MKKLCLVLIFFSAVGLSLASEESDRLSEEQIQAMEQRLTTVITPAARLFFQANIHRSKGELEQALQSLAKLTALHAHEKRWIARSELLSAKLYLELGMQDQADATARQVELLYEGTEMAERAVELRKKINQIKESSINADEQRRSE